MSNPLAGTSLERLFPLPMLSTALRLLGFVSPDSSRDLAEARRSCCAALGIPEQLGSDDDALLSRLRPVLEVRGLGDAFKPSDAPRTDAETFRCHVAGALAPRGALKGMAVRVEQVGLLGKVIGAPLAATSTTAHGQFMVIVEVPRSALVQARVVSTDGVTYLSPPQAAASALWFEQFHAVPGEPGNGPGAPRDSQRVAMALGAPLRPGRFEIRHALFEAEMKRHGLNFRSVAHSNDWETAARSLATSSGLPLDQVRQHFVAARVAEKLSTSEALAWIVVNHGPSRSEGATEADAWEVARRVLLEKRPADLEETIAKSIEAGLISNEHRGHASKLAETHARIRRDGWLSTTPGTTSTSGRTGKAPVTAALRDGPASADAASTGRSTWRDLIQAVGLSESDLDVFPDLLDGGAEHASERLRRALGRSVASAHVKARALLDLAPLVGFNHEAVSALGRAGVGRLDEALASAPPAQIAAHVRGIDAGLEKTFFAELEARYPGHAVLWERKAQLGAADELFRAGLLDLDRLTVGLWHGALASDGVSAVRGRPGVPIPKLEPAAIGEVMKLQRLLRVGRTKKATLALLSERFGSAQEIALEPEVAFTRRMERHGIEASEARQMWSRAVARCRATTAAFLDVSTRARSWPTAPAETRGVPDAAVAGGPATRIPTIATLFGPQDYFDCEECESIVSPGAYLVDLLLWLASARFTDGKSAYEHLDARRPDVKGIELTCPNTEIPVPQIDIVCELLERRVGSELGLPVPASVQTVGNREELRALPEHVADEVYVAIGRTSDSAYWPFDLLLEETRAYFSSRGSTRADAVRLLGQGEDSDELAAEELGLSLAQLHLLTTAQEGEQDVVWACPAEKITLENLLRRGEQFYGWPLQYEDVVGLLSLRFVAREKVLRVDLIPDASGVKFDRHQASQRRVEGLDRGVLDRIHRLLRLAGALGWTPFETDAVLRSVCEGSGTTGATLDGPSLRRVASAHRLAAIAKLSPAEIVVCFAPFEATGAGPVASLFRKTFRWDGGEIPSSGKLGALHPWLAAALGTDPADVQALVKWLGLESSAVSADALTNVFRHVRIAEKMGVGPKEICALRDLVGDPPFSNRNPSDLLRLFDAHALLARAGTSAVSLLETQEVAASENAALLTAIEEARTRYVDALLKQDGERGEGDLKLLAIVAPIEAPGTGAATCVPATFTVVTRLAEGASGVSGIEVFLDALSLGKCASHVLDVNVPNAIPDGAHTLSVKALGPTGEAVDSVHLAITLDRTIPILGAGHWAAAFASWLRLPTGESLEVTEFLESELESELSRVIRWAGRPDFGADGPTKDALTALRRFKALALLAQGWSAPHLAWTRNPALVGALRDWNWAAISAFLMYAEAAQGPLRPLAARFSSRPDPSAHSAVLAEAAGVDAGVADRILSGLSAEPARAWHTVARRVGFIGAVGLQGAAVIAAASGCTKEDALGLRQAFRNAVPRGEWLTTCRKIQDTLRVRRRDALAAFLLHRCGTSRGQLSAELLVDIESDATKERSRIAEACAAVQTFVNRVLLGVEEQLQRDPAYESVWSQWSWRKRYSTWLGNRMVYLFPENYLAPGKRSTASPLFRKLQQGIDRGAVTEPNVTDALTAYLSELTEIADLEYLAVGSDYRPDPDDYAPPQDVRNPERAFSVVGRTRGTPGRYFFSQLRSGSWDAFEELSLGEDPSHVSLFSSPAQTILLWPKATLLPRPDTAWNQPQPADTILAVKFAHTRRNQTGDWSPVCTTSGSSLFKGSALTERQLLLHAAAEEGDLNPGEFKVVAHFPRSPTPDNLVVPSTVSEMSLLRDTTAKVAYGTWGEGHENPAWVRRKSDTGPLNWSGPSPADELVQQYLSTRTAKGTLLSVQPWSWSAMHFDQNRMISNPSRDGRASPLVTPRNVQLLRGPSTPYSVTVLPWRQAPAVGDTDTYHPSTWAFFVNGVGWSFFVVEKDGWEYESGINAGKQALTLAPRWFGRQPFAAAAAYHPFAHALYARVKEKGLSSLYVREVQRNPGSALGQRARSYANDIGIDTTSIFIPSVKPGAPAAVETIDFTGIAPYALYNWEVFFHAPMLVALTLHAAGRHEEARRFFHHVFNPLEAPPPSDGSLGAPWWVCAAFDDEAAAKRSLEEILREGLATKMAFAEIEQSPFDAHKVAANRPSAYQRYAVMQYLQNLLDWADTLYRLEGDEDVDEASQLYALAARILGERPLRVPPFGERKPLCFGAPNLWGGGGNVLVELENLIDRAESSSSVPPNATVPGFVHLPLRRSDDSKMSRLYFAVPRNDRLLNYWDRVEAALRNIRTCKTLGGGALTSGGLNPTVDVQALVDAAAAGSGALRAALSVFGKQRPAVRFGVLLGKALETCNDVRSYGAAVLSALEKHDAERLALLRSSWEERILDATRTGIEQRRSEAQTQVAALEATKALAQRRLDFYSSRQKTSGLEDTAFGLSIAGGACAAVAAGLEIAATPATAFPNFTVGVAGGFSSPVSTITIGGSNVGGGLQTAARAVGAVGGLVDRSAALVATQAGYARRWDDWQHQKDLAGDELKQVDQQIAAARIRADIASAELAAHEKQQGRLKAERDFLLDKYTNDELFLWIVEQTSKLHAQGYELAMEMAHAAAESLRFEAPSAPDPFVTLKELKWNVKRRGLLAAEELALALRRMESDHLKHSKSDCVVSRRISLRQVCPEALMDLRRGSCKFSIPAYWLEALDPHLCNRRVRSLAVSIPCVGGPNSSVNVTLRVVAPKNVTRREEIRLSTALNDYGWDMSLRAESYVPFEGLPLDSGEQTWWQLAFEGTPEVDPDTISDVVLHVEYTADVGSSNGYAPTKEMLSRCIDLQRDAPEAWYTLIAGTAHRCTIRPTEFTPRLLKFAGFEGLKVVALDRTGSELPSIFAPPPSSPAPGESVEIRAQTGSVDWTAISRVVVRWTATVRPN